MTPLFLPAPEFHRCVRCRVSSAARAQRVGFYWVEHLFDMGGDEPVRYDLCDLCTETYRAEMADDRPTIALGRGTPPWGDDLAFNGLEKTPLICVADTEDGWKEWKSQPGETWLFCRTRGEWRVAWQLARILVKHGNNPEQYQHLLNLLPAYKLANRESCTINVLFWQPGSEVLLDVSGVHGLCDRCGHYSENLTPWDGSQWVNCPDCHQAMVQASQTQKGAAV